MTKSVNTFQQTLLKKSCWLEVVFLLYILCTNHIQRDMYLKTETNPSAKSRHVQLTDAQWKKVYFIARLIEHQKGLPPYALSRQVAFQVMVDALPDPPEDWTPEQHFSEIDFDGLILNGFMTKSEPGVVVSIPYSGGGKKLKTSPGSGKRKKE